MLGATAAMWALIEADLAERGVAVDRSSHQCALLTGSRQALGLADKVVVQGQCRPHAYLQASLTSSNDDVTRAALVTQADRFAGSRGPPPRHLNALIWAAVQMRANSNKGGQPRKRAFRRTPGPSLTGHRSCAKCLRECANR